MQAVTTISSSSSYSLNYTSASTYSSKNTESSNQAAVPTDQYLPSSTGTSSTNSSQNDALQGFDLKAFRDSIHQQLMDMITKAKQSLGSSSDASKWASDILYPVDQNTKAADVPTEYNADNTSQRIVDFALQFRDQAKQSGMSDEEFIKQVRDAVKEGFKLAKGDLGSMPSESAKLFNDTYQATMDKLDKALQGYQQGDSAAQSATDKTQDQAGDSSQSDLLSVNQASSAYSKSISISGTFSYQYSEQTQRSSSQGSTTQASPSQSSFAVSA